MKRIVLRLRGRDESRTYMTYEQIQEALEDEIYGFRQDGACAAPASAEDPAEPSDPPKRPQVAHTTPIRVIFAHARLMRHSRKRW